MNDLPKSNFTFQLFETFAALNSVKYSSLDEDGDLKMCDVWMNLYLRTFHM